MTTQPAYDRLDGTPFWTVQAASDPTAAARTSHTPSASTTGSCPSRTAGRDPIVGTIRARTGS
jgi:hypothetical protein